MSDAHAPAAPNELAQAYAARIEAHLERFDQGHDSMGHLFAVERLARAARAERWETQRDAEQEGRRT